MMDKPELLAPGGNADAVKAAILAGADAVYCGLPSFNARKRAENIMPEQFKDLVSLARRQGVKIYLTLNTLILENELEVLLQLLGEVRQWGVDAVIVQDWGLLYLLREQFPAIEVHASTQMTTHNAGQMALLARLGVTRANLCRELSLPEITDLCAFGKQRNIAVEVFVHGAYCISFSGQCYLSSTMSGRSGNRGECSQPCRKSYFCSRQRSKTPVFNLKDNSAFPRLSGLLGAGVKALKIEGRMRGCRYVYAAVSAWRRQIDRYAAHGTVDDDDAALHSVFNRSLSCGYLDGRIGKAMFAPSSGDQSLIKVGTIRSYTADTGTLRLEQEADIDPQTPVRIYSDGFTFVCTGFCERKTGRHEYRLRITHKLKGKIKNGDLLYRQDDGEIPADLQERIDRLQVRKQPLTVALHGSAGIPLNARFSAGDRTVSVATEAALSPAKTHSLTKELLAEKLGMLGGTPFELTAIDCSELGDGLFLPLRELNSLRRRGVAMLTGERQDASVSRAMPVLTIEKPPFSGAPPSLAVLVDDEADLRLSRAKTTRLCFELPVTAGGRIDYYAGLFRDNDSLIPWFPSILIGGHFTSAIKLLTTIQPALIITDNSGIGTIAADEGIPWVAGPLLNCTNSLSLRMLQRSAGCRGAFISHELNCSQMKAIIAPEGFSRWFTLFAPLLLMNTRQCIVRNCIDCGKEQADDQCVASCGKKADLLDDKKKPFYVVKRPGFYNQVFNGSHYFNPAVIADVDRDNAVFLLDLRRIPSRTVLHESRQEFVQRMEEAVSGVALGRAPAANTTAGQYVRGL